MIDMLHLIQLRLLRFSELTFPVFVKQLTRSVHVGFRRPECDDFLRARAAGEKLNDFPPMRGCAVTMLLQTALDDVLEFRPLRFQPTSKLVGQINGHLHVQILAACLNPVNSGIDRLTAQCRRVSGECRFRVSNRTEAARRGFPGGDDLPSRIALSDR